MPATRVLITVKAYPKPSGKYEELVCSAGLLEDGTWIRIYPVPFRLLDDQRKYPKYAWIQLDLERRDKDFRPESFRPVRGIHEEIKVFEKLSTADGWRARREIVLRSVYTSMDDLIQDSRTTRCVSLATLRPTKVVDVVATPCDPQWPDSWQTFIKENDLFQTDRNKRKHPIRKVPYDFHYRFETADGRTRNLQIEDWELGALYWNCLRRASGDETEAVAKVRDKFLALAKADLHLFLGTTLQYHRISADNPFIIVGVFYPPRIRQPELF